MGFVYMPDLSVGDKLTSFECDVNTIKRYLTEIGNTYLLVAYRIYEMSVSENFKPRYKNIADACYAALGFKKSTTYNMINIVKRFGVPGADGRIEYSSLFGVEKFSYSQLTEMLSMSDRQMEQVKPDMSVRQIKQIKKTTEFVDVVYNVPQNQDKNLQKHRDCGIIDKRYNTTYRR